MDTVIISLPPKVGAILMENVSIVQIVAMFSIGAYNALETAIVAFDNFKHYRSLYFWSIQIASWGILVHAIPAMARFVSQASNLATSIPFMIGWYAMVTGQAVVLYSRLHLLVSDMRNMRWVLWMIIINACLLHIPMTVFFFGVNNGDKRFARPAAVFDRIQLTGFCIQDLVISGIYIYEAVGAFKLMSTIRGRNSRSAIIHLFWINILVVLLDILLLLAEFRLHYIQVSLKTVVYSIKLKLEFSVLNRLSLAVLPCTCKRGYTERASQVIRIPLIDAFHSQLWDQRWHCNLQLPQERYHAIVCYQAASMGIRQRHGNCPARVSYPLETLHTQEPSPTATQAPIQLDHRNLYQHWN
ncbi:unnamed protein product [Penicillium salamii]|nr:unnamed protein product [Penicillium salamii]